MNEDADSPTWRARARIDFAALRHNLARVRELAPGCKVMAVLKANAYGHGIAAVSRALADSAVDALAVATVEEGIACRSAGSAAVVVLSGLHHPGVLADCARHGLQPVLHTMQHMEWIENYRGQPLELWLKIDSGMHRFGIPPARAGEAIDRLRRSRAVARVNLMSHLANADDPADDTTTTQLARFRYATDRIADLPPRSLANSAGVMNWPATHLDWVRPGIMLYGGSPTLGRHGPDLGLRPVMQLEARLLCVKDLAAGESAGYGGDFTAPADMKIGIVGFGYGDGYPRRVSGDPRARALLNGMRVPIIGRVAMDMLTVDVSACDHAAAGQTVLLWGDGLGVDEVAEWAGTIAHDLLCRLSERVPRVPVNS